MSHITPLTKNILVAENDLSALESVEFMLRAAGYRVYKAQGVDECDEIIKRHIIHAAVVDLRLADNKDAEDTSGFAVVQHLLGDIPAIIYTAYQNYQNFRAALTDVGAKDMVYKSVSDASEQLLESIDSLFQKEVRINFGLEISGTVSAQEIAQNLQLPDDVLVEAQNEDIDLILRRLFLDAQKVTLEPLFDDDSQRTISKGRAIVLSATPYYSDGGTGAAMVLKFGARSAVDQEDKNHSALLRFISGTRLTILEEVAYSREVGALCYRLFGRSASKKTVTHLHDYFAEPTVEPEEIASMVNQFFNDTFESIYRWAEPQTIDIFTHYAQQFGLEPADVTEVCHDLIRNDDRISPSVEDGTIYWVPLDSWLPEPSQWIAPNEQWRAMAIETKECLSHGDFHSRNLLVDEHNSLWLIDFERVAQSHWLRDTIELETDLKFQLKSSVSLDEYYILENGLFYVLDGRPNQMRDAVAKLPPAAKRVHRAIASLRRDARQRFELERNPIEYYSALLISTINLMQLRSTSIETLEQAYLSASILCAKVEQMK